MLCNRIALLEYDVAGARVVHERMVFDHITGDEYDCVDSRQRHVCRTVVG
jgi:hypothetical protein